MGKAKAAFEHYCQAEGCGWASTKWSGFCPRCGSHEIGQRPVAALSGSRPRAESGVLSVPACDIEPVEADAKLSTGVDELDRCLTGGLTPGGVLLLAGDPGIGKSTLALQTAARPGGWDGGCLYASSEESREQVAGRLTRLCPSPPAGLLIGSDTQIDAIIAEANRVRPALLVVDSISMLTGAGSDAAAGSPNQIKEAANKVIEFAKGTGAAALIVGHRTKADLVAGPMSLAHAVDQTATVTGDPAHDLRMLRILKDRFGPADTVGLFEMTADGMVGVSDPSSVLLAELDLTVPGVAVAAVLEGRRAMLIETQALTAPSQMTTPRRAATGLDTARLHLLLAVLERRARIPTSSLEVYAQAVGGLRVEDQAVDLAVLVAVASAATDRPVRPGTAVAGEVGLAGQVRSVAGLDRRLDEVASAGGFSRLVTRCGTRAVDPPDGVEVVHVETVTAAIDAALT